MAEEYSDDNLATYFGDPSDFRFLGDETPDHDLTPAEAARVYGMNLDSLKDLARRLISGKGSASEYGGLASILGGLYGANRSSGPTILNPGYKGGIPQVTATRTMLTQPPAGRRPGSGGINYGGDVTYARTGQNLSAENAGISTPVSQPLGGTSAPTQGSGYDLPSLLALIQQLQGAGLGATGGPSAPSPTSGTPIASTPVVDRPPAATPTSTPSTPVAGGQSGLNLYEPGYEKRFGSTPPGSFVVGASSWERTPEELKAEYEKNVRETALGGARYLQDLINYQPTGKSAFGDLYARAMADPSLLGRRSDESMEDALMRLKSNIMEAEQRQGRRQALRSEMGSGNDFVVSGQPYGDLESSPYGGVGLMGALENMRRIQAQNPQLKDLRSAISAITGSPFSEVAPVAPEERIVDDTGLIELQDRPVVPVAPTTPGTGGPGATPSGGGIQDLFQQIYGRAGSESEVKNIAGMSPEQARNILETSLANYRAAQQPMHTAQPQGLPLIAAPQQNFEMVPSGMGDYMVNAAKGGLLPDGFVVPADVVSHLGNGSSEAGLRILASKFGARPIKGDGDGMSDSIPTTIGGEQPARVANEEAFIPPSVVKRLGDGDTERGAKKLYTMMDRIRKARTGTTEQGKEINPEKFMPGGKVNRYQTGGNITTNPSAGLASSSLAEFAGPYVADLLGKGQALTEMPYQAYTGPLTAGPSALEQQAFGAASTFQPSAAIGQAAQTAGGIAGAAQGMQYKPVGGLFDTAAAQQYMNPYLQSALEPQMKELKRQSDIQRMSDAARLSKAGAFGGSRQAIIESEAARNLLGKQADILGAGYATAYDKAQQAFAQDQARKIQEAQYGTDVGLRGLQTGLQAAQTQGQLGGAQTQYGLENIKQLAGLGGVQRGIEAEGIAADRAQFEEARLNPFKMLQFQQSLLSGLPLASQSLYQPGQSNLQQFASGATTVQALLKSLGLIK